MERKRSLSASSTDSWSVIDHRRTSSCDDTADEAEESVSLYFDEAIIADEAFESSDEENDMNESDIVEDSDIELAQENISDSENEAEDDEEEKEQQQNEQEQQTDDEEVEADEDNQSNWSSDEEEEIKESVWVDREDIRESGGLYFESPEHIKSNFDEIDRKEGWKLVSRVLTIYFSIIAVLLAVEAGLQMYKRNVPEPDYPVLIADIYGLQYRWVDFDSDDLPSFACIRNDSFSSKIEKRSFIQPLMPTDYSNSSIEEVQDAEIYHGFSTYLFKPFSPRRNSSRFQVLSRLVQSKPFTSPISFKSSICYKTTIAPRVSNRTSFCLRWQQNFGNDQSVVRQAQSVELSPQLVSNIKVPVYSNICVGQSDEQKRDAHHMSASLYTSSQKVLSRKLKRSAKTVNRLGPRAPEPVHKKQSKMISALPSRRIRMAKPNILVAPPRNRLTLPKHSNLSISHRVLDSPSRPYILRQSTRRSLRAVCSKSAPKPSVVRSLPPIKYRSPKPVRYSVGPVTEKSLVPCHSQKSYLPHYRKNKMRFSKPSYVTSNERASNAFHGLHINKTSQRSDQCDSRFWNMKKHQMDKRRMKVRKGIDHKTPTPCAARYKIESSIAERKQYHLSERRLYRNPGNIRNSSRSGCSKTKTVVPAKKALLPKCRSESKSRKGKEIKSKFMCKHQARFD